jgi:hypothetical protein
MKQKPYKAKTLSGAQAYVRMLLKQRERADEMIGRIAAERDRLRIERRQLAMAAGTGCFSNPLEAMAARTLRDQILRDECGLLPDGTPLPDAKAVSHAK